MHRWVALLALAACEPPAVPEPPIAWVVTPPPASVLLGELRGTLGRSQSPQRLVELGIAGPTALPPLRGGAVWEIPGDGPARAAVSGVDRDGPAVDLIDIDGGRVIWRSRKCTGSIVAVTADAIVCADGAGTRAIGLDGSPRWQSDKRFRAATADRIAVGAAGELIVLAASRGDQRARIALPRGVTAESIVASCGDGRELFAAGGDGKLTRIAEPASLAAADQAGSLLPIAWSAAVGDGGEVVAVGGEASAGQGAPQLDACSGDSILVDTIGPGGSALVAIARSTGALTGHVDGVRGWWPARDGSQRIEVATASGLVSYPRDLTGAPTPALFDGASPALGSLIAARGDRRLVRATPATAVLLDRSGVRAYVALAANAAALGQAHLLAAANSPSDSVHRFALPLRWNRRLRLPPLRPGLAVDAELRDLPPVVALDSSHAAVQPDTGMRGVVAYAVDPADGAAVYAVAIDRPGERAAVARVDLAANRWRWQRVDGCGPGTPIGLALAADLVVCASRSATSATIRATSRDGAARWSWTGDSLDAIAAGGDTVIAFRAAQLIVFDARDGHIRGQFASDDGGPVRAAITTFIGPRGAPGEEYPSPADVGRDVRREIAANREVAATVSTTLLLTVERGRIVARLPSADLLPVWSIAIAGAVRALAPTGAGALVVLDDGDAYRIDARTAAIAALPGLGLGWHAAGDLIVGDTAGGPIPAPAPPNRPPTAATQQPPIAHGQVDPPAPMSTPIILPPPLGISRQLAVYELTGGLRARNDYALPAPIAPLAPRGPAGSPLVVAYGPGLRDVIVIDPRTGSPLRRVRLPDGQSGVFGTVVDGSPVAGVLLGSPLRVVVF